MIVWSGRGFLIVLVLVACLFLGAAIFPEDKADYAFVLAGFVSAIFSWFAGVAWNTKSDKIVIDEETGERILLSEGGGHKLFWIPMQYWGIILTVVSIIILAQHSMQLAAGASIIFLAVTVAYRLMSKKFKAEEPEDNYIKQ